MVRAHGGGRARIGFLERIFGGGRAEPAPPDGDPVRIAQVEGVLSDVRPLLAADGGDVHIVAVTEDGVVRLKFVGACAHCFQSPMTIRGVLVPRITESLDWVREVDVR